MIRFFLTSKSTTAEQRFQEMKLVIRFITPHVDVLVEFEPGFRFGLLTFCELENYLSDLLELNVDLVMKKGLKPHIGEQILREVVYL